MEGNEAEESDEDRGYGGEFVDCADAFIKENHKGVEIDCKGCPEQGSPYCRRIHNDFMLIGVYNFQGTEDTHWQGGCNAQTEADNNQAIIRLGASRKRFTE